MNQMHPFYIHFVQIMLKNNKTPFIYNENWTIWFFCSNILYLYCLMGWMNLRNPTISIVCACIPPCICFSVILCALYDTYHMCLTCKHQLLVIISMLRQVSSQMQWNANESKKSDLERIPKKSPMLYLVTMNWPANIVNNFSGNQTS